MARQSLVMATAVRMKKPRTMDVPVIYPRFSITMAFASGLDATRRVIVSVYFSSMHSTYSSQCRIVTKADYHF